MPDFIGAGDQGVQLQADILGVPVSRPVVAETTALGAACVAGLACGCRSGTDELRENWAEDRRWEPTWDEETRSGGYQQWRKAVQRTLDRVDVDD
jgi:glycerol kinase